MQLIIILAASLAGLCASIICAGFIWKNYAFFLSRVEQFSTSGLNLLLGRISCTILVFVAVFVLVAWGIISAGNGLFHLQEVPAKNTNPR